MITTPTGPLDTVQDPAHHPGHDDLDTQRPALPARRSAGATLARALPAGFAAGVLLGIGARLWMRLITDDPHFSWAGTLYIVGAFAMLGVAQAVAWTARRTGHRRRTALARVLGVVLTLPIFAGAGSIMLPTVVTAALACWRTRWPRWVRLVVGALAAPVVVIVLVGLGNEFGWGLRSAVGFAAFVVIYSIVVAALAPTVAPLPGARRRRRP